MSTKVTKQIEEPQEKLTIRDIATLFAEWLLELSGFILLPLIIYTVTFLSLGQHISEVLRLPEWMLIAVILHGDNLKRMVIFYREYRGFEQKFIRVLSLGLIGITISSVLLCFSLIAQHRPNLILSSFLFRLFEGLVFFSALSASAATKIWIGKESGELDLYRNLIPENARLSGDDGPDSTAE